MSPQFLTIFSTVFLLLGAYNLFTFLRRRREARARAIRFTWYKQINLLTGAEYLLLACVFMLSTATANKTLSPSLKNIVFPLYIVFLLGAAILAGLVIRQGILNTRVLRAQARAGAQTSTAKLNGSTPTNGVVAAGDDAEDAQQRAIYQERRRERRRNAAAARRRRAGKA